MAKEMEMSVRDTIDLDAALAQFIRETFDNTKTDAKTDTPRDNTKEDMK